MWGDFLSSVQQRVVAVLFPGGRRRGRCNSALVRKQHFQATKLSEWKLARGLKQLSTDATSDESTKCGWTEVTIYVTKVYMLIFSHIYKPQGDFACARNMKSQNQTLDLTDNLTYKPQGENTVLNFCVLRLWQPHSSKLKHICSSPPLM